MSSRSEKEPVAYFEVKCADPNKAQEEDIDVFGNKLFYLGRDAGRCERSWSCDETISGLHLRIHCILYEQNFVSDVPPCVYATDISTNGTFLRTSQTDHEMRMKKDVARLLNDGDKLRIVNSLTLVYRSANHATDSRLTLTQEGERPAFESQYLISGRLLGSGAYGKVYVAYHQKTQHQLACKVVNLKGLYNGKEPLNLRDLLASFQDGDATGRLPARVARCFREFQVLDHLAHPNIVGIEKVFWSPSTIYIFEELFAGGDLFSFIEYKGGYILNNQAAIIVWQILKGIKYLHGCGIVHRDLKPDNILMTSLQDGTRVVITDFGNARYLPESQGPTNSQLVSRSRMFSQVGTVGYVAPEVWSTNQMVPLNQGYSKAVDMWSIGAVTAAVLSGELMFSGRAAPSNFDPGATSQEISMALASKCDLGVIDDEYSAWSRVCGHAKDFVKGLLILSEVDRMNVDEALEHPWFTNPEFKEWFHAIYKNAIKDWERPPVDSQMVEAIPSPREVSGHFPMRPSDNHSYGSLPPPFSQAVLGNEDDQFEGSVNEDEQFQGSGQNEDDDVLQHEEAQFEGPDQYEEDEFDEFTSHRQPSSSLLPEDAMDYSMDQLSISNDSLVSGLHRTYADENSQQKHKDSAGVDSPMTGIDYEDEDEEEEEEMSIRFPPGYSRLSASQAEQESPILDGTVRFPPGYTPRTEVNASPQSSIVHETPYDEETGLYIRRSQRLLQLHPTPPPRHSSKHSPSRTLTPAHVPTEKKEIDFLGDSQARASREARLDKISKRRSRGMGGG